MAILTIPSGLAVKRADPGQRRFDLSFSDGDTGNQQARLLAPPRWLYTLVASDRMSLAQSAAWRALILGLDGQVNQLAVYDLLLTAPQGTARGTWTANGAAAAGATSIAISAGVGQAGKTILAGDYFGVNQSAVDYTSQLLHAQADVTLDGSGNGTVTFKPALRGAVAGSSSIVWDKPTCLMRQQTKENRWSSEGNQPRQTGHSLDLMESWE